MKLSIFLIFSIRSSTVSNFYVTKYTLNLLKYSHLHILHNVPCFNTSNVYFTEINFLIISFSRYNIRIYQDIKKNGYSHTRGSNIYYITCLKCNTKAQERLNHSSAPLLAFLKASSARKNNTSVQTCIVQYV